MFVLTHHKKHRLFTHAGRSILAIVIALTALANIITVMRDPSWSGIVVTEPLIDLGGSGWERDGFVITGILMLLIARALQRGKRQAWFLSVGLLTCSLWSAVISRSDRGTIVVALSLLVLLLVLAPLFPTRSDTGASVRGYAALAFGIGCLVVRVAIRQLWWVARIHLPHGMLFSLHLLAFVVLGYGVIKVLRPVRSACPEHDQEYARAREIVQRYGNLATVHFALGRDKNYFWSETGQTMLAYRVVQGVALVLGDPIGPRTEHMATLSAFLTFCRRQDWPVALYQASAETYQHAQEGELHAFKIGAEAIIDITRFTLQGKVGAPVRHAIARAKRSEIHAQCWQGEALPQEVFAGMQQISAAWLEERKIRSQLGFSMGCFPTDWSEDLLTVVAFDSYGEAVAFLTWTPLYAGHGWALDAIRREGQTPPGTMELLIAHSIEWARAHGFTQMSLGLAPLAGLEREALEVPANAVTPMQAIPPTPFERSAAFLHRRGIVLGSYRSINAFKAKFQPTWEARYLIVSESSALPRILLALAQAHDRGWGNMFHKLINTGKSVTRLLHAS